MLKNLKDLGQMVAREVEATPYSIMFLSLSTLPACDALTMMCCELGSVWVGIKNTRREKKRVRYRAPDARYSRRLRTRPGRATLSIEKHRLAHTQAGS